MRAKRSARRLPRYVTRRPLSGGKWGYFFNLPGWTRRDGCPVGNEPLGTDFDAAVIRAETVLLPAFDAWLDKGEGADVAAAPAGAKFGTLDWVVAEYRKAPRGKFNKLDPRTRRNHEVGFRMVSTFKLADGRRLGEVRVSAFTTKQVDELYEKLLVVREVDAAGNVIERERRTTVNHAMKTWRRAWNVATRSNPGKMPLVNPFAAMGLQSSDRETPTATLAELQVFRAKAIEMGLPSLATAALIGFEWMPRVTDIFGTFDVSHYRPKARPNAVRVVHEKTDEELWVPLLDDAGAPLYPELMAELDAIKRGRIGGLMLCRDRGERLPWPTWPNPDDKELMDLTHMSRTVKEIIRSAGLRDELTFTSFRHGGFTEGADADLSDAELRAQGRHKSKVLPRYAKRTMKQVAEGQKKRRALRAADEGKAS